VLNKLVMVQFEIAGDPTFVHYGYDEGCGIFLSVHDKRLMHDESASDAVNNVFQGHSKINVALLDGGGCYLDMHTGKSGFGIKVSVDVISTYLQRFGALNENIQNLKRMSLPKSFTSRTCGLPNCDVSEEIKLLQCSICKSIKYCSVDHQRKHWATHKVDCGTKHVSIGAESKAKTDRPNTTAGSDY
jgi:hypothetical protein